MRLVVDTSVLVGELLRATGRGRLGDERLDLFLPEPMWGEVQHEIPRRVTAVARRRSMPAAEAEQLSVLCLDAVRTNVAVLEQAVFAPLEEEARSRVLRDASAWPLVASALALAAGIWTGDNDLLGTGVATWTTHSLQVWLDRHPAADRGALTPRRR